jgi:DNA replication protein DnaC
VLNQATLEKMQSMKMSAMAEAFQKQFESPQYGELSFEERVGMLIDTEWTAREQRKLARRLKGAKLRYPACLEDLDYHPSRGLDRQVVLSLGTCAWITSHQNLLITGPTGTGKTYLACSFAERACRSGFTAHYVRAPRLLQDLTIARADGSYGRLLTKLAKLDLLAIDDWLITGLKEQARSDLLEVIEDRTEHASTLIATQLPVEGWHAAIGEPTMADAICDRLIHRAHRIELRGPSLRDRQIPSDHNPKRAKST